MDQIGKGLQSTVLLIARIGLGAILILQGISHWQPSGEGVQRLTLALRRGGRPVREASAPGPPRSSKLVGGIFLVVGALTRIVGAGVVVLSALSISYLSWYKCPAVLAANGSDTGGIEYDVALGLLGTAVLRLRRRRDRGRSAVQAQEAGRRAGGRLALLLELIELHSTAVRTGV